MKLIDILGSPAKLLVNMLHRWLATTMGAAV